MTWADAIAIGCGVLTGLLITLHQHHEHRSSTAPHTEPQDGERP